MAFICNIWLILLTSLFSSCDSCVISEADRLVLQKFWHYAQTNHLKEQEAGERISSIARFFLDTPYKSNTLNTADGEKLIVNLRELDCVTFVENVLALAFLPEYTSSSEDAFKKIYKKSAIGMV